MTASEEMQQVVVVRLTRRFNREWTQINANQKGPLMLQLSNCQRPMTFPSVSLM